MRLFDLEVDSRKNWLPRDGKVYYYGKIFNIEQADFFFEKLENSIEWKNDEAVLFGKKTITSRKVAWYGQKPFKYTYSGVTKFALNWTEELLRLKNKIEQITDENFNTCLLNLYNNGTEGMSWHSDNEKDLKNESAIASLSFGTERRFSFKHKLSGKKIDLILEHGSLLLMKGNIQTHWLHSVPIDKRILLPRINLTFRTIVG